MIPAVAGAVVLGVFLYWFFVMWRVGVFHRPYAEASVRGATRLLTNASLCYGLSVALLSPMLTRFLRKFPKRSPYEETTLIHVGAFFGALMSLLNPLSYAALPDQRGLAWTVFGPLMVFVLGASWGAWIGWQVYREKNPERGRIPRFYLSTLIALVLGWGLLLWILAPPE
jgi:hypothetical protein